MPNLLVRLDPSHIIRLECVEADIAVPTAELLSSGMLMCLGWGREDGGVAAPSFATAEPL